VKQVASFGHSTVAGFLEILDGIFAISGVLVERAEASATGKDSLIAGFRVDHASFFQVAFAT
jgi:hypothetical protein